MKIDYNVTKRFILGALLFLAPTLGFTQENSNGKVTMHIHRKEGIERFMVSNNTEFVDSLTYIDPRYVEIDKNNKDIIVTLNHLKSGHYVFKFEITDKDDYHVATKRFDRKVVNNGMSLENYINFGLVLTDTEGDTLSGKW
ncbi:hypothetical protein CL617_05885 [archaeon]|jgi:hypothetical protein|nr:hypothetical protein [archaeon]|tara:strand:- start:3088 stop:3510 length:423 start_codon:yes stop_codon:yes gene_type:complete